MIDDLITWGMRLFRLLPEIMGIWTAVKDGDATRRLDAQLALERRISDLQAAEELLGLANTPPPDTGP